MTRKGHLITGWMEDFVSSFLLTLRVERTRVREWWKREAVDHQQSSFGTVEKLKSQTTFKVSWIAIGKMSTEPIL